MNLLHLDFKFKLLLLVDTKIDLVYPSWGVGVGTQIWSQCHSDAILVAPERQDPSPQTLALAPLAVKHLVREFHFQIFLFLKARTYRVDKKGPNARAVTHTWFGPFLPTPEIMESWQARLTPRCSLTRPLLRSDKQWEFRRPNWRAGGSESARFLDGSMQEMWLRGSFDIPVS